jgi:hypothetical protein
LPVASTASETASDLEGSHGAPGALNDPF